VEDRLPPAVERRLVWISSGAFIVVAAAIATLVLVHGFAGRGVVGLATQGAGVALLLWARFTFGRRSFHAAANPTAGGLVTNGPYRYIRNPIYAGGLIVVAAGVASHPSLVNGALGAVVLAGLLIRIRCEERLLTVTYPEYAAYRARTGALLPIAFGRKQAPPTPP
jgi:protein-S-isoprenylcysteine O-methyltransferase Ste14